MAALRRFPIHATAECGGREKHVVANAAELQLHVVASDHAPCDRDYCAHGVGGVRGGPRIALSA